MKAVIPKNRITPADIVVILSLVFLSVVLFASFFSRSNGDTVTVSTDNKEYTFNLNENAKIPLSSEGHNLTVVIENGEVFVTDSDCPDKICEKTGHISKSGSSIICVPAHICISVTGESEVDYAIR